MKGSFGLWYLSLQPGFYAGNQSFISVLVDSCFADIEFFLIDKTYLPSA